MNGRKRERWWWTRWPAVGIRPASGDRLLFCCCCCCCCFARDVPIGKVGGQWEATERPSVAAASHWPPPPAPPAPSDDGIQFSKKNKKKLGNQNPVTIHRRGFFFFFFFFFFRSLPAFLFCFLLAIFSLSSSLLLGLLVCRFAFVGWFVCFFSFSFLSLSLSLSLSLFLVRFGPLAGAGLATHLEWPP